MDCRAQSPYRFAMEHRRRRRDADVRQGIGGPQARTDHWHDHPCRGRARRGNQDHSDRSGIVDPVGRGFIPNMPRPGGNITGILNFEFSMGGKWLETLKQVAPLVRRVALLFNPETAPFAASFVQVIEGSAESFAVEPIAAPARDAAQLERAVVDFAAKPGGGLIVLPDMFTVGHRGLIIALAARYHLPAVYPLRAFAESGGLISDSGDPIDIFRRAASYVDRILKGANPGDLPVQTPTKFELVINLKTAKTLGLDVPPTLLARADEVIE
jgi:putative ABC transport system substrate-binding protein